jgi:ABC-type glycerol-3-phosphate transport system substrate-binding protein
MKKSKKLIIIAVVTVLVLGGILGGVAIANADEPTTTTAPAETPAVTDINALAQRIADAYEANTGVAIDAQELVNAFEDVQKDIRSEALDNYLDKLVEAGKITDTQAQEFKDWIEARPDVPIGPSLNGGCGGFGGRFGGMMSGGRFGGMMRGWFGPDKADLPIITEQ